MNKFALGIAFAASLALAPAAGAVTVVESSGGLDFFSVAIDPVRHTIVITEVWGPTTANNVRLMIDDLTPGPAWKVTKIVTNNTGLDWHRFNHELLNGDGTASDNTDGLSFSQNLPVARTADLLPKVKVDELSERDYLTFFGGTVASGQTVTFRYGIRDTQANSPFFLKQSPIPEPATWALLIAGFGMVGFAARRRTRSVTA